MKNTSRLHRLAQKLSFERVPETCCAVHTSAIAAMAKFEHWTACQRWSLKMTRTERRTFEKHLSQMMGDIVDGAKSGGTLPLRAAHVREIEDHLRMNLTPERIVAVEAGQDIDVNELFGQP
jgi:hypothetical protein